MSFETQSKLRNLLFMENVGNERRSIILKQTPDQAVPPKELMQYGETQEIYLETGRTHATKMREALGRVGFDFTDGCHVLDFGCSNGRVLRWLSDVAHQGEFWGVDINANTILWAHQHLSPPFHFAVSTTAPHLFFESRFFELIYSHSVFSHIDDLFLSWIQELRRILKIGGYLFVTQHDEMIAEYIEKNPGKGGLSKYNDHPDFRLFRLSKSDFVALGRDWGSDVFVRSSYFSEALLTVVQSANNN